MSDIDTIFSKWELLSKCYFEKNMQVLNWQRYGNADCSFEI